MARFRVHAAHLGTGREVDFEVEADDVIDAEKQASVMGFAVGRVVPVQSGAARSHAAQDADDERPYKRPPPRWNPLQETPDPPPATARVPDGWPAVICIDHHGNRALRVAGMQTLEIPVRPRLMLADWIAWVSIIAVGTTCGFFLTLMVLKAIIDSERNAREDRSRTPALWEMPESSD